MWVYLFRFSARVDAFHDTSQSNAVIGTIPITDILKDKLGLKFYQIASIIQTYIF
jgi:hypothetical protein